MSTHNIYFHENEALLMSTHNICFHEEVRKNSTYLDEKHVPSGAMYVFWTSSALVIKFEPVHLTT